MLNEGYLGIKLLISHTFKKFGHYVWRHHFKTAFVVIPHSEYVTSSSSHVKGKNTESKAAAIIEMGISVNDHCMQIIKPGHNL